MTIARVAADCDLTDPDALRGQVGELLAADGAVLVRGVGITDVHGFHRVVASFGDPLLDSYRGGNTPRTAVSSGVFTSTEYPAQYEITLHNEMSYARRWPARLYFGCLIAAETGGATPVCSGRALLADLDPGVRERFETRGVVYRQYLHGGFGPGKSWQQTFETDDRALVEGFLRDAVAEFEWTGDDGLRVVQRRPAVRAHPVTGDQVWFAQADQWHPSNLPGREAEFLLSLAESGEDVPHWVTYGDGSPIPAADLDAVRVAAGRNKLSVGWQPGDLMVIDNMLVLHGREPFTGERSVIVSMT